MNKILKISLVAATFTTIVNAANFQLLSKNSSRSKSYQASHKHSYSTSYSSNLWFSSFEISEEYAEDSTIFYIQPINELIGEAGTRYSVKGGITTKDNSIRAYIYGYNTPSKNNEMGIGFGGDWTGYFFDSLPNVGLFLGGEIGFGYQKMKGETRNISTAANKFIYVTEADNDILEKYKYPTSAIFTDDTYNLEIGLNLGAKINITKALKVDIVYVYHKNNYQISYKTIDDLSVLNNITFEQDVHSLKFSLNYQF